jgi:hypothetical protein
MAENILFVPYNLSLTAGQTQDIYFFPYKMSSLEVFNYGPSDIIVTLNNLSLPNGIVVYTNGSRVFSAEKGVYTRIGFYCSTGSANILLNASR